MGHPYRPKRPRTVRLRPQLIHTGPPSGIGLSLATRKAARRSDARALVIARTVAAILISLVAVVAFVPAGKASVLPSAAVTKPDRTPPQCHLALPSQRPATVRGSGLRVVLD